MSGCLQWLGECFFTFLLLIWQVAQFFATKNVKHNFFLNLCFRTNYISIHIDSTKFVNFSHILNLFNLNKLFFCQMPEMNTAAESEEGKKFGEMKTFMLQNAGLITGYLIMLLLAIYAGSIDFE